MAELFDVEQPAIAKHLINIYNEKELDKNSTYSKMELVQKEGNRSVKRNVECKEVYNMDYRYDTKDDARDFHKQRKAFIILNSVLEFLPDGSSMSHFEYCQCKGLDKEDFNKITRGYYLNGNIVFYKDNFIYDENVIDEALKYLNEISQKIGRTEFEIYFGQLPEKNFALDFYYGKYLNGKIIKFDEKRK